MMTNVKINCTNKNNPTLFNNFKNRIWIIQNPKILLSFSTWNNTEAQGLLCRSRVLNFNGQSPSATLLLHLFLDQTAQSRLDSCYNTMYAFVVLFCLLYNYAYSARILAIFPHTGKSHFDVFEPLVLALAKRGHDVSVLSFFPQKHKVDNLTDYSLVGSIPIFVNAMSLDMVDSNYRFQDFLLISKLGLDSCEPVLSSNSVTNLLNSDKEFDLLIFETFNIDCFLGFAHRFKAPYIGMSSTGLMPIHNSRFGNPQNPANVPNIHYHFCDKMSFVERIINTVSVVWFQFARTYYYDAAGEKIARKYFGTDMPSLREIANNAQLLFTNTHYTIHRPRPLVPAIVPVGGLHINPAKKLPQVWEIFS